MSVLAAALASRPSGVIQEQLLVPGMAKGNWKHQKECWKVQGARTCSHPRLASFCSSAAAFQSPAPRASVTHISLGVLKKLMLELEAEKRQG